MSRAFVKDLDGAEGEELPELAISAHRNLVTPEGLERIVATLRRLDGELTAARAASDRATVARVERDLRYWSQRRSSAEVVAPLASPAVVRFGCTVELLTESGERVRYRIVGEDESDPAHGMLSHVAPLAEALRGAAVGDVVPFRGGEAGIVAID
jgi:transcription elongation GreA/GreB family factor